MRHWQFINWHKISIRIHSLIAINIDAFEQFDSICFNKSKSKQSIENEQKKMMLMLMKKKKKATQTHVFISF